MQSTRGDLGQLDDGWQRRLGERPLIIDDCYFYHWIDLPDGSVVRGNWDLRRNWEAYLGHVDLKNQRVLELGPASGFLSLKMESLGAHIVAFDLPSNMPADLLPLSGPGLDTASFECAAEHDKLRNSWWYVNRLFNSKNKAVYGSIYDLPPDLGRFDVSVFASILLHLANPFAALQQAARITDKAIIVVDCVTPLDERLRAAGLEGSPVMEFAPCDDNPTVWWNLTPHVCARMLHLLGFTNIKICFHEQLYYQSAVDSQGATARLYTLVATRPGASLACRIGSKLNNSFERDLQHLIDRRVEDQEQHARLISLLRSRSALFKAFVRAIWNKSIRPRR